MGCISVQLLHLVWVILGSDSSWSWNLDRRFWILMDQSFCSMEFLDQYWWNHCWTESAGSGCSHHKGISIQEGGPDRTAADVICVVPAYQGYLNLCCSGYSVPDSSNGDLGLRRMLSSEEAWNRFWLSFLYVFQYLHKLILWFWELAFLVLYLFP